MHIHMYSYVYGALGWRLRRPVIRFINTYISMCVCTHTNEYVYRYTFLYICIYINIYIYICICIYVYMYVCICVYMYRAAPARRRAKHVATPRLHWCGVCPSFYI